mmetsp:Transcript_66742/g.177764  ORF Transcript_66742/g.177764 Transcript_66742/m.177764 type:complete len:472 (-) Transcript_66742:39-1454(-)
MARLLRAAVVPIAVAVGQQLDNVALLQAAPVDEPVDINAPFRQPLINFGDAQYIAYVTMGGQLIPGMVDTGSSELVVFGATCTSCGPAPARYNPMLSSTYQEGKLQNLYVFGNGGASCVSSQEQVSIGPFRSSNQTFWAAETADMPILENAAFEAVIGLAPPELPMINAWQQAVTMVQKLTDTYDNGELAPREIVDEAKEAIDVAKSLTQGAAMLRSFNVSSFSICFGAKTGSNGVLVWNDKTHRDYKQLFTQVPITGNATWTVKLSSANVSGRRGSFDFDCAGACDALLDSGSSLIGVPRAVKETIQEAMQDLNSDCTNLDALPSLHFKLGEATVSLTPDAYVARVSGVHKKSAHTILKRLPSLGDEEHKCKLMLVETDEMGEPEKKPLWVLGMPFFRKYYTSFSIGRSRADRALYIAPSNAGCIPTSYAMSLTEDRFQEQHFTNRTVNASHMYLSPLVRRASSGEFLHL